MFIWWYLHAAAKREKRGEAYRTNRAIYYYLNQMGIEQGSQTPSEFAEKIDKQYDTNLRNFSLTYQKMKYDKGNLSDTERDQSERFYLPFISKIKNSFTLTKRIKLFLNIYHTIHYFTRTKNN